MAEYAQPELTQLRQNLEQYFSKGDLETLAFDLGIDYENLNTDTKPHLARDLVQYCQRRDLLPELLQLCRQERPSADWPDDSGMTQDKPLAETGQAAEDLAYHSSRQIIKIGDTYNIGNISGSNVNINSTLANVSQNVDAIQSQDEKAKEELRLLLLQLGDLLEQAQPEESERAEAVADFAHELVAEASGEKPNSTKIRITGAGLKKAAENLVSLTPAVLGIATQIAELVTRLTSGS